MSDFTFLLPALNEERAIGLVIDEIRKEGDHQIIVGDNGSADGTTQVCKDKGIEPITVSSRGKGNVIQTIIPMVKTPYTVMVNSDYTYPILGSLPMVGLALSHWADVVICTRTYKEKDSMSHLHAFGNWGMTTIARMLYRFPIRDLCTGLWGFNTEVLQSFTLTSTHFTLEADLFVNAIKSNCAIYQTPIAYRPRLDGSKAKVKISDGIEIVKFLVRHWR
jgi:dolichol-phosphate mannosyltransferase